MFLVCGGGSHAGGSQAAGLRHCCHCHWQWSSGCRPGRHPKKEKTLKEEATGQRRSQRGDQRWQLWQGSVASHFKLHRYLWQPRSDFVMSKKQSLSTVQLCRSSPSSPTAPKMLSCLVWVGWEGRYLGTYNCTMVRFTIFQPPHFTITWWACFVCACGCHDNCRYSCCSRCYGVLV